MLRRHFAGISVAASSNDEVVDLILEKALNSEACDVHLLESNGVATAERNREFATLLNDACVVLPDGRWLEILTRGSSLPLMQFRGEDLFRTICDRGREQGLRHYFVGSTQEKIDRLTLALSSLFPGIVMVGEFCPPFRPLNDSESAELSADIRAAKPHIVWLGISTPRQDFEGFRLAREHNLVTVAVGAAFEFVSGDKKKAPPWMTRLGIEWLFRLFSEPRRLAKRYLVGNVVFLWRVLRFSRLDKAEMRSGSRT